MEKKYLMGVDLGTSATKAALYSVDGTLVVEASQEVPVHTLRPGVVEQENDDFYTSAATTVSRCLQASGINPRQVAAIACDSQMAGIGSIDENFKPATRFDSWLDMRCQPYIDWLIRTAGERIIRSTGCPPSCNHGPKMLWWQHERPQEYDRIARFITPSGYVAGTMAGLKAEQAFIDYTFIHYAGVSDSQSLTWSKDLADLTGIKLDKLPRIVEPWTVIGEVTPEAARDFGLAPGTPIAAGCGDTAACALGAGIVRPGMLYDTAGTAAVLAACTNRMVADTRQRALLSMHSVIPGLYHPLAYIAGGGLALRWFRDQFYNPHRGVGQALENDLYQAMVDLALEAPPGADGLLFSPHLGGRICPAAPAMRGAWIGFSWGHTQAHFMRSILESIAFEYAYYLSILVNQLPELQLIETRAVGGGARSQAWNQIKADVLGVPYRRLSRSEFGTWGSALVAGKAAGLYDDLATVAEETTLPVGEPILPDKGRNQVYEPLVKQYIHLQDELAGYFSDRPGMELETMT
jgi:xylulokinase